MKKMIDFLYNRFYFMRHCVKIGKNVKIFGKIVVFGNDITIGKNVIINSGKKYNAIDGGTYSCLCTFGEGKINIGNNVGISNSIISSRKSIVIEDDVLIGGNTKIYDNDFHPILFCDRFSESDNIQTDSIIIKRGAFIGAHTIILKGVTIGEESIIGAGSVLTKSVPAGEIWAGNPARFIRKVR